MSVLIVELSHHGIVMGADKNLTYSNSKSGISIGQSQRTKIIRLPSKKGLIGYVGAARVGNLFTDEWLQEFIYENVQFPSLENLVKNLAQQIQAQRTIDEGHNPAQPLLIHVGGFEPDNRNYYPLIYLISNVPGTDSKGNYLPAVKQFSYRQEIGYKNDITHQNIKKFYQSGRYGWFHQGIDLGAFNIFDNCLNDAFYTLNKIQHPKHPEVKNIVEQEPYIKMKVLSYGAYYSSFFLPNEQYVGGGADILSIPWPEDK